MKICSFSLKTFLRSPGICDVENCVNNSFFNILGTCYCVKHFVEYQKGTPLKLKSPIWTEKKPVTIQTELYEITEIRR